MFNDNCGVNNSKLELVRIITKHNATITPYLLEYAVSRRRNEVRWSDVYMPLIGFLLPSLFCFYGAFLFPIPRLLYAAIGMFVGTIIYFRVTIYTIYLRTNRLLYMAASQLAEEAQFGHTRWLPFKTAEIPQQTNEPAMSGPAVSEKKMPELKGSESPAPLETPAVEPGAAASMSMPEPPEFERATGKSPASAETPSPENFADEPVISPGKGSIPTVLLHELIKKEAQRPNVFSGDMHQTLLYYSIILNCQRKNILNKARHYQSRKSIVLHSENARTTHIKYLETLFQYYRATGEDVLLASAESLKQHIEMLPLTKH